MTNNSYHPYSLISTDHEIVDHIFNTCSTVDDNPGLTLAEVKNENCMKTLDTLTGATKERIEDIFKETDANGDGFVMKSEVMTSLKGIALNRSINTCKTIGRSGRGYYIYECSNSISCVSCSSCTCGGPNY